MLAKTDVLKAIREAILVKDTEAFLGHLTDDVEYHYHMTTRPLLGKVWVRKFLDKYYIITSDMQWRIDRTADGPDFLMVEGYEEYTDTRNGKRISHPYMSIYEFRGDKIAKWRDYFEMNVEVPAAPAG